MSFYVVSKKGIIVNLHISPNAPRTYICGKHGDCIKIKLKAPPVDGEANKELIKFLSKEWKIPKSKIKIVKGLTSRTKTIIIE